MKLNATRTAALESRILHQKNQSLNLNVPPVLLAFADGAVLARKRGVGKHRVFRSEPPPFDFLLTHPAGHPILDHGGANDLGVPEGAKHRSVGMGCNPQLKRNGAHLIDFTSGWTHEGLVELLGEG